MTTVSIYSRQSDINAPKTFIGHHKFPTDSHLLGTEGRQF